MLWSCGGGPVRTALVLAGTGFPGLAAALGRGPQPDPGPREHPAEPNREAARPLSITSTSTTTDRSRETDDRDRAATHTIGNTLHRNRSYSKAHTCRQAVTRHRVCVMV